MDPVEQIRSLVPLEDVVAETVTLKPAGPNRLKGLCPFHPEKTPSFHVVTDKGFYHCFSCSRHGSVYDFVMETQGLEFREALEQLAQRAGVTLPERSPHEAKKRDLYDLNDMAQSYFRQQLAAHSHTSEYLAGRGLTAETIETWGLGFAPEGWQNLIGHAHGKGVDGAALIEAGLAKDKSGRPYDLFRDRITIPIRDIYGRVVGFSARTLGDDTLKYVNTPETAIFHKGNILFGLERAKTTIKDKSAGIVVEGQLDVIALHQAGFTAAVGAQSATLTEAQITALERLGMTQLYMAFDADPAGQRATLAGCDAVARRFIVKVAQLSHKDPAEIVQEDPELFRAALKVACTEAKYRFASAKAAIKSDLTKNEGRLELFQVLAPFLVDKVPGDGDELRHLVAAETNTDAAEIKLWAGKQKVNKKPTTPPRPLKRNETEPDKQAALLAQIMALALHSREFLESACAQLAAQNLTGDPLEEFANVAAKKGYEPAKVLEHYRDDGLLFGYAARDIEKPQAAFNVALKHYLWSMSASVKTLPVSAPPGTPSPTEKSSAINIPGYDELRAYALEQKDNFVCIKLLEAFERADSGDKVALGDLTRYLQDPQVRQQLELDTAA